jgi:lipopolysaccharide export system protein LptA
MMMRCIRYSLLALMLCVSFVAQAQKPTPAFAYDNSLPVEITADSLEVSQKKNIAIFKGDVEAHQGQLNIAAQKMTVYYLPKEEKSSEDQNAVSRIVAEGEVFLTTPNESAKGDKSVFDVANNKVVLTKNVVVTRGKTVVKGDILVYDLSTGKSSLNANTTNGGKKSRVKGVFVPQEKN